MIRQLLTKLMTVVVWSIISVTAEDNGNGFEAK